MKTKTSSFVLGLSILSFASIAGATPNFPPAIEEHLSLGAAPPCALCHDDGDQGGRGTVNTPFGKSVRSKGVVAYDVTSLTSALDAMQADGTNSAGACLDDVDELKAGGDPNAPAAAGSCGGEDGGAGSDPPRPTSGASGSSPTPAYGCGATVAPRNETPSLTIALFLSAILLLGARRRRS